jgi:thioester reductase-like protein
MSRRVVVVTGFPTSFLAKRVVRKVLREQPDTVVRCVVQPKFLDQARRQLAELPEHKRTRIQLLEGDSAALDLGLSGAEFNQLAEEVHVIHHCAAVTYLGADSRMAERTNVGGAREIVELAEAASHLERLVHWSTALVSGARRGYVLEEELTAPAGFRNPVEETRFRAEKMVREASEGIPTTILRPGIVVGDSVSGEIDRLEGPYLLVLLLLNAPVDLRIPLPGRGDIPLNLVPIDFVVDAAFHLLADHRSIGKTLHIVDPAPLTARRVFELIASAAGRPLPRGSLPTTLATTILRTPGLERISHVPRGFLEQLGTEVVWDDRNARDLLSSTGLECPGFESYVGTMVEYVKQHQAQRQADSEAAGATAAVT